MAMAEIDSRKKSSGFRKKPLLVCSKATPQTNVGKLSVPNLGIRFKDTYCTSRRKFDDDGARPVPHLQLVSPVVHWNRHTHYWSLIDVGGAATPTSPQSDMHATTLLVP